MYKSKNSHIKENLSVETIRHERINFLKDFKTSSYVKKVLCLYETGFIDNEYYQKRETTNIACVDKEVLIISDYSHSFNTYILVQTDFSLESKYKVLMVRNTEKCGHLQPKEEMYKYIKEHQLVEIKDGKPEVKKPQIDFGYGKMFKDILEALKDKDNHYRINELDEMLVENVSLSDSFLESKKQGNDIETLLLRFHNRSVSYLDMIYKERGNPDTLCIQDVLTVCEEFQTNYYYNI